LPRRGKKAITGAPTRPDLPTVRILSTDTAGHIVDRYIADLLAAGFKKEAAAVGNLYDALVKSNAMVVPESALLLSSKDGDNA
jgi:hypothetical protein